MRLFLIFLAMIVAAVLAIGLLPYTFFQDGYVLPDLGNRIKEIARSVVNITKDLDPMY